MQVIPIKYGQTPIDVALMAFGDAERIFELPLLGSITDNLTVGSAVEVDGQAVATKRSIASVLNNIQFVPASLKNNNTLSKNEGIGYWAIGQDFVIASP